MPWLLVSDNRNMCVCINFCIISLFSFTCQGYICVKIDVLWLCSLNCGYKFHGYSRMKGLKWCVKMWSLCEELEKWYVKMWCLREELDKFHWIRKWGKDTGVEKDIYLQTVNSITIVFPLEPTKQEKISLSCAMLNSAIIFLYRHLSSIYLVSSTTDHLLCHSVNHAAFPASAKLVSNTLNLSSCHITLQTLLFYSSP